jgi:hypothetical protein
VNLVGVPYLTPGWVGLDFLEIAKLGANKWSHYSDLFGKVEVSIVWVQIYFWLIPIWAACRTRLRRSNPEALKYMNDGGYVVLADLNELEHRYIARQLLGRRLHVNEVVHHVNGIRTDNRISNLCLMNDEKHEHFHAWLRWKKEKSGSYPSISDQKRVLEQEYQGTLLENL